MRKKKNDAAFETKAPTSVTAHLLGDSTRSWEELYEAYRTSSNGLKEDDVSQNRDDFGKNIIVKAHQQSVVMRFILSFVNPFTMVLLILAAVTLLTDVILAKDGEKNPTSAIIILTLVLGSGLFRFFQESRSSHALEKLTNLVETTTAVRRDDQDKEIPLDEVVVGDYVSLAVGDIIPADVRLLSAKDFFVSQSSLTGESEPVEKTAFLKDSNSSLTDRNNLAFMGSTVISGSATALVIAVGNQTAFGQIASKVTTAKAEKTAFDKGVDSVSWLLVRFMLVMAPAVFLINGLTKNDWLEAFLFAISVAVGLTPEMLPMIVTSCLARGAIAMGKKKVIIKNINSIQDFGAMDVLCTDKTGTLTQDRVALEDHLNLDGIRDYRVLKHAFLNSYYQTGLKNLMDKSIIAKTKELSVDYPSLQDLDKAYSKVDEIPFDFARKRMSVVVKDASGKTQMITKGAVEEILSISSFADINGVTVPLTPEILSRARETIQSYARQGFRIIAVAQKTNPSAVGAFSVSDEKDMVLIGYLVFFDPPKKSTASALKTLKDYGVSTKILTGDTAEVTAYVASLVGLDAKTALLGKDIEAMDDETLQKAVEDTVIFAKLSPEEKARVVQALKANGHVVGYMGDGINDAPALKAADIGISVDNAVDIAKESAHVILLEKDLGVLEAGLVEGRKTYANMIKYIKMTASSNFGNMFSELAAAAFLPFLPMLPLQLLLLNLIYDLSCVAIPFDNVDSDYLKKPRKWEAKSIGQFMLWLGPTSSFFDWITYVVLFFVICPLFAGGGWNSSGVDKVLFVDLFQTGWFIESLYSQSLIIHMIRTAKLPLFQSHASWQVNLATTLSLGLATSLTFIAPLASLFSMVSLPWPYYVFLAVTVTCYMLLTTVVKNRYCHRFGEVL
ncbi:MAG: magnesium-translocating P-type ATPase [Bacilli bacterium]|jgi:Mg2+-importing ATPase|nr:magnesium-translocating P-type ATPase [Bacilli bacterium]